MLTTVVLFIIILGVLVFVHELGHFISARIFGVKSEEFGFGYPPRMFGFKKVNGKRKFFWGNKPADEIESEDTIFSLNWLPLGGFVSIKGENGDDKDEVDPDSFGAKKAWKRVIILSAGVAMNFVFAMVILAVAFMIGLPQVIDNGQDSGVQISDSQVQILQVVADSPADEAGLQVGDTINSIEGQEVNSTQDVSDLISNDEDQLVLINYEHFGETKELELSTRYNESTEKSEIGVALVKTGLVKYPWYESIWLGIKSTVLLTGQILVAFYNIIKNLMVGMPAGVDVAGPVGIAVMTGQVASLGFVYILQFAALLSINLGIINLLPIPALDGGRILFILIEKIRRKPVSKKVEQIIHATGFLLLMVLIVVITGRDIYKFRDMFMNFFSNLVN